MGAWLSVGGRERGRELGSEVSSSDENNGVSGKKRVRSGARENENGSAGQAISDVEHKDKRQRTGSRECDIRGSGVKDVKVKAEYMIRVKREEDGGLSLETGDRPLYSAGFLSSLSRGAVVVGDGGLQETREKVLSQRGAGEIGLRKKEGEKDGEGAFGKQLTYLDYDLRKKLRKREVLFPRSEGVLRDVLRTVDPIGGFGEREKKMIDMRGKVYLAPLTTVGNLPFRRICKRFGADITCGEMAMARNLLQGQNSEWALLRRHEEEDLFGVQIAGSNINVVTKAAELISRECCVDFLELNAGCPIDIVFNRGAGCSLMTRRQKFCRMVSAISSVIDIPLGVKMRAGVNVSDFNAHSLIAPLRRAGASWITVHGRSRKQRYSKQADWGYISGKCGTRAREAGVSLLGSGDVYNWEDAMRHMRHGSDGNGVDGVMLARGALIKPWLFTEIREQRDWDIRSAERLEIYRNFARFGLQHWGADQRGVETTRRFMLEWLSFCYRYVPIGIQDACPAGLAQRAPFFRGRDDLETLFGSPSAKDWVRITEMVLGPAPKEFDFVPRHKSNAWG